MVDPCCGWRREKRIVQSRCRSARRRSGLVGPGSASAEPPRAPPRTPAGADTTPVAGVDAAPAEGVAAGSVRLGPTARRICSRARSRSSDCAFRPCRRRFSACCSEGVATRAWPPASSMPAAFAATKSAMASASRATASSVSAAASSSLAGRSGIRRTRRHRRAPDRAAVPARNGPCPPRARLAHGRNIGLQRLAGQRQRVMARDDIADRAQRLGGQHARARLAQLGR